VRLGNPGSACAAAAHQTNVQVMAAAAASQRRAILLIDHCVTSDPSPCVHWTESNAFLGLADKPICEGC